MIMSPPKILAAFAIGLIVLAGLPARARPLVCSALFDHTSSDERLELEKGATKDWNERRLAVIEFLKAHPEVPSFLKQTEHGSIPVLLLNEQTFSALAPLLNLSISYGFTFSVPHPEARDHAMLRVESTLMDIGHMGTRRGGEINSNGIKWLELKDILPWRRPMVQNSYLMSKADRDVAKFYQLVRRASFFRSRYAFAQDHELDRATPNLIEEVPENCYRFCKADQTPAMIDGLRSRLKDLLGADLDSVSHSPEAKRFLQQARALLLRTNPYDASKLNWSRAKAVSLKTGFDAKLPQRLTELERDTVANLLVSERATTDYLELLRRYRISDHHGYQDIDAGTASFTIIMDNMAVADQFRSGHYETHGAFFHWTSDGQSPLH